MTADMKELVARQRAAQSFLDAAAHTAAESERIAYALDARLVMHPELVATADDYPGWTPGRCPVCKGTFETCTCKGGAA